MVISRTSRRFAATMSMTTRAAWIDTAGLRSEISNATRSSSGCASCKEDFDRFSPRGTEPAAKARDWASFQSAQNGIVLGLPLCRLNLVNCRPAHFLARRQPQLLTSGQLQQRRRFFAENVLSAT